MAKGPSRKPLTLLMLSGCPEKIHMALMFGATAAAVGRPVTYFFSKSGIAFITKDGWQGLKTADGQTGPEMDAHLEEIGVADSGLLLAGIAALDVRFVACESALREHAIDVEQIVRRPPIEISGLADVMEKGAGGDWMTF